MRKKTQKAAKTTAIILAAGKSTRMKTTLSKVLHPVCGRPIIEYVINAVASLKSIHQIVIVVGHAKEDVIGSIQGNDRIPQNVTIDFVTQREQKGTAHAVQTALPSATGEHILIVCGDSPLITQETLSDAEKHYRQNGLAGMVLTTILPDPASYGRIIRDHSGALCKITETRDLPVSEQKSLKEVNSGMYFLHKKKTEEVLNEIKENPGKKEFYLTDLVEIFNKKGYTIDSFVMRDPTEMLSVNTLQELAQVERLMNERLIAYWMRQGVRFVDPQSTFICSDTVFGTDTIVYPFVYIESGVTVGKECRVGPFIHLRKGVTLEDTVEVGNFLEIARSKIQSQSKAKHFGYLGDVTIGHNVNIGAGTVVANYDGKHKNKTVIEDGSFIGSDTVIVAPVTIGKDALTGAGSVITKNVPHKNVVAGVPARTLRKR